MISLIKTLPVLAFAVLSTAAPITVTITACAAPSYTTTLPSSEASAISTSTTSTTTPSNTATPQILSPPLLTPESTPSLPSTNSGTQLPASNHSLQHITLGHGIQNYSCTAPSAIPVAVGALATLYDITTLRSTSPSPDNLPSIAAFMPLPATPLTPLSLLEPIHIPAGIANFPVIGHHFFTEAGVPTFDLSSVDSMLSAKKAAGIKAPETASKGPDGTGAVDWLYLVDSGNGVSKGCKEVYRVVTAGGSPPVSCLGVGDNGLGVGVVSIPYAAEYWFFG